MAYMVWGELRISWVPDGAGPLTVLTAQSINAQASEYGAVQPVLVPGGDAPTAGNIATAAATLSAALAAALPTAQIQGWATGNN